MISQRNNKPTPLTVSTYEAARLLGVTARTLYAMRERGQLRAVPVNPESKNSKLLYVYADLVKFAQMTDTEIDHAHQ